jgi:hypothetical protein
MPDSILPPLRCIWQESSLSEQKLIHTQTLSQLKLPETLYYMGARPRTGCPCTILVAVGRAGPGVHLQQDLQSGRLYTIHRLGELQLAQIQELADEVSLLHQEVLFYRF